MDPLLRRGMVLGLLIAVGAFGVDIYTPSFVAITRDLHATASAVQLSMTAYFLAAAIGQIAFGPLSDAAGRRGPLLAGLLCFACASAWAGFAGTIGALIAARFVQGFGAAATAVVPLAVITDEYAGPDAARLLSLAILSLSISPILAPSLGGLLVQFGSWRLIFAVLAAIGLGAIGLALRFLPETLPPPRRVRAGPLDVARTYGRLVSDRRFLLPILIAGAGESALLAFIAGAPFVFERLYGLAPVAYGLVFAAHAAALIGVSQFNAALMRRLGVRRLLSAAVSILAGAAAALAALLAIGPVPVWLFAALTVTIFGSLGAVLPPAFLAAVEPFSATGGAAAALGVAVELSMSTGATALVSALQNGSAWPMVAVMTMAAAGTVAALLVFLRITRAAEG